MRRCCARPDRWLVCVFCTLSQRAARQQQRDDLGLRDLGVGEERHARLPQGAADVDARGDVGKFLDRAQVETRIPHEPVAEQQSAALDVEIAAVGQVLAFLDLELAAAAADAGVVGRDADAAAEAAGEAGRVDGHALAELQRDVAVDLDLGGAARRRSRRRSPHRPRAARRWSDSRARCGRRAASPDPGTSMRWPCRSQRDVRARHRRAPRAG